MKTINAGCRASLKDLDEQHLVPQHCQIFAIIWQLLGWKRSSTHSREERTP